MHLNIACRPQGVLLLLDVNNLLQRPIYHKASFQHAELRRKGEFLRQERPALDPNHLLQPKVMTKLSAPLLKSKCSFVTVPFSFKATWNF